MTSPQHLIIGGDGMVGAALVRRLRRAGHPVAATTRRKESHSAGFLQVDLAEDAGNWQWPVSIRVAIICAGVTNARACKDEPAAARAVNVEGICKLVERLVAGGAFVIFLSTNQVFDGSTPFQKPDAPYAPLTEYGRQKVETEQRLARLGESVAIVRFAKILGPNPALIPGWAADLRAERPIHPFSDMPLAPTPLSCAVTTLSLIADLRLPGIFQVSAEEEISYADAAHFGAIAMGSDPALVQPIAGTSPASEPIPAHTTLNTDRLKTALGITPPSARWTIETAFTNPQLLEGA